MRGEARMRTVSNFRPIGIKLDRCPARVTCSVETSTKQIADAQGFGDHRAALAAQQGTDRASSFRISKGLTR